MSSGDPPPLRPLQVFRADIPPELLTKATNHINEGMDKCTLEKDLATFIKKKCDEDPDPEHGGTWHCVVGRNFGCSITHDTKYVLFCQVELMHILMFKSRD